MSRSTSLAVAALVAGLVFSQPAIAEWLHYTNGVTRAESAMQRHPRTMTLRMMVPTDVADPTLCASYESNHPKGNRGRISAVVRILRADGSTKRITFSGKVTDNLFFQCIKTAAIAAGDMVTFKFTFKGLPKQLRSIARSDFYSVNGVVSDLGVPGPRLMPPGVDPPESGGHTYNSISMFSPDRNRQRHPKTFTQYVMIDHGAATPVICSALGNVAAKANKGRVLTAVEIMHADGSSHTMSFNGRVRNNIYSECQLGASLTAGDVARFDYVYKRLPKLRLEGGFADPVATYAVISPDGIPTRRSHP